MSQSTTDVVERAYHLVEEGHLIDARRLLEDWLEDNHDDADAWWVYSHAVEDVDAAKNALNNVLRLDPDYPGADDLMEQLREVEAQQTTEGSESNVTDESLSLEDEGDVALRTNKDEKAGDDGLVRWLLIGGIVGVLILVGGFILLSALGNQGEDDDASATAVFQQAQAEATAETTPDQPGNIPTATNADNTEPDDLDQALRSDFTLVDTSPLAATSQTQLGQTRIASVCAEDTTNFLDTVTQVMQIAAEYHDNLSQTVDAFGVAIFNCDTNTQLNTIGVTVRDLSELQSDELTQETFRGRWRVLRR